MKKYKMFLTIAAALTLFVACKKKDDGGGSAGGQPAPNLTGQACTLGQVQPNYICVNNVWVATGGGQTGQGNLLNNVEFQNSYFQGLVFLAGVVNSGGYQQQPYPGGMQMDFNNPQIIYYYSGQVTVNGNLNIQNPNLCGAPAGTYSLNGMGQIYYGSLYNLTLNATGPAQLQLRDVRAVVSNPQGLATNAQGNRLGILYASLVVNGNPCGVVTAY